MIVRLAAEAPRPPPVLQHVTPHHHAAPSQASAERYYFIVFQSFFEPLGSPDSHF